MFDESLVATHYKDFSQKVGRVRQAFGRPLTLTEKILYAHLWCTSSIDVPDRGATYANFKPDRVAMQDATAQMALLQFMNAGRDSCAVPATVHCDHLIRADEGAAHDLSIAQEENREVYGFLKSVSDKYGLGFWGPGAGIIHQVVLENYAFPGGLMIGTDSHTPNAGGLGMLAIGVGGADAADVISGMPWELKAPKVIGVHLKGKLSGWTQPKDVILAVVGLLTVKGGTDCVIEYFGEGAESLSATGKATICNMGAEAGATTSVFAFDAHTAEYLRQTGRAEVADWAGAVASDLRADPEVMADPAAYYDRVIEIDLSTLEPHVNGPFTPDRAHTVAQFGAALAANDWPAELGAALIGSCTNSSFEDLTAAASLLRQATAKGLRVKTPLIINPGSRRILQTLQAAGAFADFEAANALVMANACGPCIGQWRRHTNDPTAKNSIVTTFNRNFAKRADGNPNTHAFIASPVTVTAWALAGRMDFNPATDTLTNDKGEAVKLEAPCAMALPAEGLASTLEGFVAPTGQTQQVAVDPASDRIQVLEPFAAPKSEDFANLALLIKTQGKCTTDHISMAGPWLRFRGHLANISKNLLMGAVNAFNGQTNQVKNQLTGALGAVSETAAAYKAAGVGSFVAAEDNYGEGSSREHAAMEPRFLNVKVIIAKSFARIHETNLKKQGVLALTFLDKADYDRIAEGDKLSLDMNALRVGAPLTVTLTHADGSTESFDVRHTYNELQSAWFKAGSALNHQRNQRSL